MNIDLNRQELKIILAEKFGNANFRLFYTESDKAWEERTGKKISEQVSVIDIDNVQYVLPIDD